MKTHIDLFSGIGGFALGLKLAGFKTVQFVEIDKFCQNVLQKNFPGVPIHDDIKTFKYSGANPFILTAGTPCQPASCAGKRRGTEDDRWLWDEVDRVIRHVKSRWIILENVLGLATLAEQYSDIKVENKTVIRLAGSDFYKGIFTRQEILQLGIIIQKVEDAGYQLPELKDGTPIILVVPACAVNAPHERKRIWIVANCPDTRIESLRRERENTVFRVSDAQNSCRCGLNQGSTSMPGQESGSSFSSDADCHAADTTSEQAHTAGPRGLHAESCGKDTDVTDTGNQRLQGGEKTGNNGINGKKSGDKLTGRCTGWQEPWIEAASRLCKLDARLSIGLDGCLTYPATHGIMGFILTLRRFHYATSEEIRAREILPILQQAFAEETVQRCFGRLSEVFEAEDLWCPVHGEVNGKREKDTGGISEGSTEISRNLLREMRHGQGLEHPPQERNMVGRCTCEFDDIVHELSHEIALGEWQNNAEKAENILFNLWEKSRGKRFLHEPLSALHEIWRSVTDKEIGAFRRHLDKRNENRIHKLKALGNAVVPQIVTILGNAIMDIERKNGQL